MRETPGAVSTRLVHLCPGGAWSFVGRVYDAGRAPPAGLEAWEVDDGQVLGNLRRLDGERPAGKALADLMAEARRQPRPHDAGLGLNHPASETAEQGG